MPDLFTPIVIRNTSLKNRIVVSPMQQYSSHTDGFANDWHLVHYGSRAVGGAGLLITESAVVSPEGRSTVNDLGIWSDAHIDGLKKITSFVHSQHTAIAVQLAHFGSKGSKSHPNNGFRPLPLSEGGWQTVSSSAVAPFAGMALPVALSIAEIKNLQQQFTNAAMRAVGAGFDAVELHAAHGYLFHQFYSALINQRTDAYGGSFENRIRMLIETVNMIRASIPTHMPLMVRISAVDYTDSDNAWQIEDSVQLVAVLKNAGVDVVTASAGGFVWVDKASIMEGYQLPFAATIKAQTGITTAAVGGIQSPQFANQVIAQQQADLVVIAREHLRDPYFSINAAKQLEAALPIPWQYKRAF